MHLRNLGLENLIDPSMSRKRQFALECRGDDDDSIVFSAAARNVDNLEMINRIYSSPDGGFEVCLLDGHIVGGDSMAYQIPLLCLLARESNRPLPSKENIGIKGEAEVSNSL